MGNSMRRPRYTGPTLRQAINAYRAYVYHCAPERFEAPGTTSLVHERLAGTKRLYYAVVGEHIMLRPAPEWVPRIEALVSEAGADRALSLDELIGRLGAADVAVLGRYHTYYLDPVDFRPASAPAGFVVRHLPRAAYDTLPTLFDACSEDDLDEAEILLDEPDPVIYCGYVAPPVGTGPTNGPIVAYASHRYWGVGEDEEDLDARDDPSGLLADIGVLIHPDYRRRGLGKAVVSHLTRWCIEHDVIPMYRVDCENTGSFRVPHALGYRLGMQVVALQID